MEVIRIVLSIYELSRTVFFSIAIPQWPRDHLSWGAAEIFTKQCSERVSLKTPVWSWRKSAGNAWGSNSVFLYHYFQRLREAVDEKVCSTIKKASCLFLRVTDVCMCGYTCEGRLQLDGVGSHLPMDDSRDQAPVIGLRGMPLPTELFS